MNGDTNRNQEPTMTKIENPGAADMHRLDEGQEIRVNGRRFTVTFTDSAHFVGLQGPRGGQKQLVPSVCRKALQLTNWARAGRDWVRSIEV